MILRREEPDDYVAISAVHAAAFSAGVPGMPSAEARLDDDLRADGDAARLGLLPPDPSWAEHFQVRLLPAWDGSVRGTFRYAAAFDRL